MPRDSLSSDLSSAEKALARAAAKLAGEGLPRLSTEADHARGTVLDMMRAMAMAEINNNNRSHK